MILGSLLIALALRVRCALRCFWFVLCNRNQTEASTPVFFVFGRVWLNVFMYSISYMNDEDASQESRQKRPRQLTRRPATGILGKWVGLQRKNLPLMTQTWQRQKRRKKKYPCEMLGLAEKKSIKLSRTCFFSGSRRLLHMRKQTLASLIVWNWEGHRYKKAELLMLHHSDASSNVQPCISKYAGRC